MPPRGVKKGTKRARQYEHVKDSAKSRGVSTDRAEEDRRAHREQGARALGRVPHTVADLAGRRLAEPARRPAVRHRPAEGTHPRAALQRGQEPRHRRPFADEQVTTAARRRHEGNDRRGDGSRHLELSRDRRRSRFERLPRRSARRRDRKGRSGQLRGRRRLDHRRHGTPGLRAEGLPAGWHDRADRPGGEADLRRSHQGRDQACPRVRPLGIRRSGDRIALADYYGDV